MGKQCAARIIRKKRKGGVCGRCVCVCGCRGIGFNQRHNEGTERRRGHLRDKGTMRCQRLKVAWSIPECVCVCVCVCMCVRVTHRPSTENSLTWKGKIGAFEGQLRSICLCVNLRKAPIKTPLNMLASMSIRVCL